MIENLKGIRRNPHTIIIEGFAEIERLRSVQIKYTLKRKRYDELLDNDENVTEIDTKHFREVIDFMDSLFATLGLMIDNYEEAIKIIDQNKESVTKLTEEIKQIKEECKLLEKKRLEIEGKVYEKSEESKKLTKILEYKINLMNKLYLEGVEKPEDDDYLKMVKDMKMGVIEVITKNLSNKRSPYEQAISRYPHISIKYIDALYLSIYKEVSKRIQSAKEVPNG